MVAFPRHFMYRSSHLILRTSLLCAVSVLKIRRPKLLADDDDNHKEYQRQNCRSVALVPLGDFMTLSIL